METAQRENEFGGLLRAYRRRAGMTQQQLADLATLSVRAIRDLESGRARHPRRETVRLLSDVLRLGGPLRTAFEEMAHRCPAEAETGGATASTAFAPPSAPGRLVGREHEVQVLSELLTVDRHRLVSVVGLGGIGKSRLVLEVADAVRRGHGWPVLWVAADGLSPGLEEVGDLAAAGLVDGRDTLLVLDGVGQRSGASATRRLIDRFPALRVVLTTATPAGSEGGQLMPVGPLPVPGPLPDGVGVPLEQHASVRLFLCHLRRLRPQSVIGPETVAAVAGLCRWLDGVPGQLEAAASWCLVHSPEELVDALASDPTSFLVPPTADGRATAAPDPVDGALAALEPAERALLERLAGLPASWTTDEAALLAGGYVRETVRTLHTLLIHGVLRTADEDGRDRYRVLNRVRCHLARGQAPSAVRRDGLLKGTPSQPEQAAGRLPAGLPHP